MKIKIGKYKNCQKNLIRYGFSPADAKIICGKIAVSDTDWEVKKETEEEDPSKWETEKTPEEEEVKIKQRKRTPAGAKGKRSKDKDRPVHTEPKAMQMPLYQPWRSYKSEHRLQTKLEKIQTAEQKFLTQEQLLKRAEYALAIKKKDADPFMIYVLPEEQWDQAIGMGKPLGTTDKGYPIVRWIRKGGASIPIVMTEQGAMTEAEAEKSGAKAGGGGGGPQISIIEKLGKRAEQRITRKGEIPFASPRTEAEVEAKEAYEKEKGKSEFQKLTEQLEALSKRTFEYKSPLEKYKERLEKQEMAERDLAEPVRRITKEQAADLEKVQIEIEKIEGSPSFKTIGANVQIQIDFDELPEQDLWAHISHDLNWATERINEEYEEIALTMGKTPFVYQEVRNILAQKEAISRIKNPSVLHDFIVHTKNHYLKKGAMERLKSLDPQFYNTFIASKLTGPQSLKKAAVTYRINPQVYNEQKAEYDRAKIQKEKYLSQSYTKYFEKDLPEKSIEQTLKEERTKDKEFKANDPDGFSQSLEEMGLAKKGIITKEPKPERLEEYKLTGEKLIKEEKK